MDSVNNKQQKRTRDDHDLEKKRQMVCTEVEQTGDHPKVEPSNDEELERLAVEAILQETKRAKLRADNVGAFGWKKKTLTTNKRFINAVVCGTVSSNRRQMAKADCRADVVGRRGKEKKRRDEDRKRGDSDVQVKKGSHKDSRSSS